MLVCVFCLSFFFLRDLLFLLSGMLYNSDWEPMHNKDVPSLFFLVFFIYLFIFNKVTHKQEEQLTYTYNLVQAKFCTKAENKIKKRKKKNITGR